MRRSSISPKKNRKAVPIAIAAPMEGNALIPLLLLSTRQTVEKSEIETNGRMIAANIATPPIKAVVFVCQRSLDGLATHPCRIAAQRTIGVKIRLRPNAAINNIIAGLFIPD